MDHLDALTYRGATGQEDRDFIFAVYEDQRLEELASFGWTREQTNSFLLMQFQAQQKGYYDQYPDSSNQIVCLDGQPVGYLCIHDAEHEIRLVDIAMLRQFRQQGIGTKVIQNLLLSAAERGKPMRLRVNRLNRAISLYLRLGFVIESETDIDLLMKASWEQDI